MPRPKPDDDTLVARILRVKPPYFWWFLVNTTALCLAILSWIFFLQVFQNPDIPSNYKLLEKMGRLQPINAFTQLDAPKGSAHNPTTLYKKYYNLTQNDREALNKQFLKHYINNLKDYSFNTYIQGEYRVLQTRILTETDLIPKGVAIQAQSLVEPDEFHPPTPYLILIEIILPNAKIESLKEIVRGDQLDIAKNPNHFSIINVQRIERPGDEPLISLTVVPLVYESSFTPPKGKTIKITPPERLNLQAPFPIFKN